MNLTIPLSSIPEEERTPLVIQLLEITRQHAEDIQQVKDEIARLQGQSGRPKIRPSRLEKPKGNAQEKGAESTRPGSAKRRKSEEFGIHETCRIAPEGIPDGSTFKGDHDSLGDSATS